MLRKLAILALVAAGLSACAIHPGQQIAIHSADYGFVGEILDGEPGTPRRIWGQLAMPEGGDAPYPAIVLVHSAQGRDAQMWMYADRFNEMGIATLTLDSFTQRGIRKIEEDQTEVTEASMIADAYAALHQLAGDPLIDANRIAIFGISKGGAPSVYASLDRFAETLAPGGERFAAHIAYYPWCGVEFLEPRTTGAPILIQSGSRDRITPPELCEELIDELDVTNPGLDAQLVVLDGARHAFDHPYLRHITAIPTNYYTPVDCRIREMRPGEFMEMSHGAMVTATTQSEVLRQCSAQGYLAGGDPEAGATAWDNTRQFLGRNLGVNIDLSRGW